MQTDRASPADATSDSNYRTAIYLTLLALTAAWFLAWPIWRASFLVEIWPTEGWNAYFQDAAAAGRPIYPSIDSFVGNNYPPLSFYAIGLLGKVIAVDNLFVGRALSLMALVAIAIEIYLAVRILVGGRAGAAVGALWYLAIMARNSTVYVGTNDPQLAGEAIMGAALVWFLSRCRTGALPTPALLVMVLAGFWKHNMVAIPFAAILWLFVIRSRFAVRATVISTAACALGIACCVAVFGLTFVFDLLAVRQYAFSNLIGNIGHLQWPALALVIWAGWAFDSRKSEAARFTALHIGLSLAACLLQWFGHGVGLNAEFDLILALGIGIGVVFTRIGTTRVAKRIGVRWSRDLMVAVLLLRLIVSDRQETALMILSSTFRSSVYAHQQAILADANQVAALRGDVACEVKLVCRQAKKPFVVDEFKMGELIATGRATKAEVATMLRTRKIDAFAASPATVGGEDASFLHWWERQRP
jgi:hypothetical protein